MAAHLPSHTHTHTQLFVLCWASQIWAERMCYSEIMALILLVNHGCGDTRDGAATFSNPHHLSFLPRSDRRLFTKLSLFAVVTVSAPSFFFSLSCLCASGVAARAIPLPPRPCRARLNSGIASLSVQPGLCVLGGERRGFFAGLKGERSLEEEQPAVESQQSEPSQGGQTLRRQTAQHPRQIFEIQIHGVQMFDSRVNDKHSA